LRAAIYILKSEVLISMRKLFLPLIAAAVLVAATDPFVGTWKMDADRSKFTRGDPSFMFATLLIESTGGGLKSTASAADGDGLATDFTFKCAIDGTPCKVISATAMTGSSAVDTVSLKREDDHTIIVTGTNRGKLVYTDRRVVSSDDKTLTVHRAGRTPDGRMYESTIVLSRVH
jgi:hypothetical protein